jgi:curli biogenesis system outer membrane secretion channel CsgG
MQSGIIAQGKGGITMRTLIVSLILLLTPTLVLALGEGQRRIGPMDVIKYRGSSYETVGYIVEEYEDSVVVIPERGGRIEVRREVIAEIVYASEQPKWITSDEMIEGFTSQLLKLVKEKTTFRVAKVTDQMIYLNTSQGAVDKRGWKANIYREGAEIIDPITGDALGYAKQLVGTVQIIGEAETFSEALPVDTPTSVFQEGDIGVFLRKKPTLVVANITTVNGKHSPYGAMISEAIIGKLSESKDLTLLERKQIGQVLEEMAKQDALLNKSAPGAVVDDSVRGNMSMLKGADALLVGTVGIAKGTTKAVSRSRKGSTVTKTKKATVSIRIVHTQTGVVLYSAHYLVSHMERPYRADNDFRGYNYGRYGRGRYYRR